MKFKLNERIAEIEAEIEQCDTTLTQLQNQYQQVEFNKAVRVAVLEELNSILKVETSK